MCLTLIYCKDLVCCLCVKIYLLNVQLLDLQVCLTCFFSYGREGSHECVCHFLKHTVVYMSLNLGGVRGCINK